MHCSDTLGQRLCKRVGSALYKSIVEAMARASKGEQGRRTNNVVGSQ